MTTRGSLGWALLLAALAVPGFMFYKWWSRVNKEKQQALTQKVVNRNPDAAMFSAESRPTSPLTNPIAGDGGDTGRREAPSAMRHEESPLAQGKTAAAAMPPDSAGAAEQPPVEAPQAPSMIPPQALPSAEPITASAPTPAPLAAAAAMPPESAALVSSAPPRDPTLSPYDAYLLEQIEFNKKFRQSEVQEAAEFKEENSAEQRRVKKEVPIENTIKLQGIITNAQGNRAIIDGEMVSAGDVIGKVKVLRITSQEVTFQHKTRKFTKSVSK